MNALSDHKAENHMIKKGFVSFIAPLLNMLCATERNYGYAKEYLTILLIGMIFYVFNNFFYFIPFIDVG